MRHASGSVSRDSTVDPARLDPHRREALTDELYAVHQQIFEGVDRSEFHRYVVHPPDARTRLQVFRGADGEAVGYIALHSYQRQMPEGPVHILRSEVGVLRHVRGQALQARFVLIETTRAWLRHRRKPTYVFACPVHPGSYYGVTRRAVSSWPRPGQPTPNAVRERLIALGDSFGLPTVPGRSPLVRNVGWITRETPGDRRYWSDHHAAEVQYYRTVNPEYRQGHGLSMLVPISISLLARAAVGRATELLTRWIRSPLTG